MGFQERSQNLYYFLLGYVPESTYFILGLIMVLWDQSWNLKITVLGVIEYSTKADSRTEICELWDLIEYFSWIYPRASFWDQSQSWFL